MQRFITGRGLPFAPLLLLLIARSGLAQETVSIRFPVERDISILGWDNHEGYGDPPVYDKSLQTEEFSNHGYRGRIRGKKGTHHMAIMDWDTDAINAWLAAADVDPVSLRWTLNVYPIEESGFDVEIQTLESLNDWSEGNGGIIDWRGDGSDGGFTVFNWEAGTKAATTNFAQTAFMLDGDGDRVLDLENSVPWIENESGTGGIDDVQYGVLGRSDNFSQGGRLPDYVNSEPFFSVDLGDAAFDLTYATVPLDSDLVDALLTDPNNRGLIFGSTIGSSNWKIHSRESAPSGTKGTANIHGTTLLPQDKGEPIPSPFAPFLEISFHGDPNRLGDFNQNLVLDAPDIDDLTGQSASGANDLTYDVNVDTLVNTDDVTFWIRDLFGSWVGDLNLDNEFNSTDLTLLLVSGTYETGAASVWSQGDFNGDGVTDSSDLSAGLADGGFEMGPRTATAAVPEPTSFAILTFVSLGLLRCRRW